MLSSAPTVLIQVRYFLIEMRERRFERPAVIRMCRALEIMQDAGSRELQSTPLLFPADLLGAFLNLIVLRLWHGFLLFQLGFHVFALPSSSHRTILTQNAGQNGPAVG